MGEAPSGVRKGIIFIETHKYLTIVQYEDEGIGARNLYINNFSRMLVELSSQGLIFEEEIKALTLLSNLPVSWEVFCTMFMNCSPKLALDKAIGSILHHVHLL